MVQFPEELMFSQRSSRFGHAFRFLLFLFSFPMITGFLAVPMAAAQKNGASEAKAGVAMRVNFRPEVSYGSGGVYADAVAVADVNGDGKPDLVVANHCAEKACTNSSVGVLLGNGDGTFRAAVSYDAGPVTHDGPAIAITTGDVNGDGQTDVIVVSGHRVGILLGNGDGTFQPVANFSTGGRTARAVTVADVNGDGRPDLLIANSCKDERCGTGSLTVLAGNGDGTFKRAVSYDLGVKDAYAVSVADVNRDGKPDVVVASSGQIAVLLGNGDGVFHPAKSYGANAHAMAVGDVNGDGKADVVWGACGDEACAERWAGVLLGKGDATFESAANMAVKGAAKTATEAMASDSVAMVDVNGDGKLDLVVGNHCAASEGCTQKEVSVLLGNADGTFSQAKSYGGSAYSAGTLAAADVNGDGRPDVIVAKHCASESNCEGSVEVLLNASEETTLTATTTTVTSTPNPSVYWQSVTFTATVAATGSGTPTGTVTFSGEGLDQQVTLSGGTASFAIMFLSSPSVTVTATYSGDAEFAGSSGSVVQTINKAPTTLAVSSSGNPSTGGQPVTFSATLTGPGNPQGTLTFTDGTTTLGTVGTNVGFITRTLGAGSHAIGASYGGDLDHLPSTAPPLTQVVKDAFYLKPTALTFPAQPLHTTSAFKLIGFFNWSQSTVTVSNVTVTGDFAISANSCMNGVKPNTHCDVDVTFTPTATGTRTGSVTFTDTAANSPQTATLTGSGISGTLAKLTVDPTRSVYGTTPITFTATVTGSSGTTPTGQVSFMNGGATLGTAMLTASGTATLVIPLLDAGTYEVVGQYSGDTNNPPGTSAAVKVVVEKNTSTTTISSPTPNPAVNQPVTLTATVTGGGQPASGNVAFLGHELGDAQIVYGIVGLSNGTASLSHSFPRAGTWIVFAKFLGGENQKYSWSHALTLQVQNATTTTWTSSLNPAPYGQEVTFTVQVSNGVRKAPATGTVTLKDSGKTLGSVVQGGGEATFPITGLAKGTHYIQAVYSGDTNNQPSASPVMNQVVQGVVSTTTVLVVSPNASAFGQPVNLTAIVRSGTFAVAGSVRFMRGSANLGTVALDTTGDAVLSVTTLPVGTDLLTAVYEGSTGFRGSRSSAASQIVNQAATTTTVTSSENPAPRGTAVTFTAAVTPAYTGTATGTVTFQEGSTTLETVNLSGGTASLTISTLGLGTHTITATYNGSTNFNGSSGKVAQRTQ
jgi:hypothetical protein